MSIFPSETVTLSSVIQSTEASSTSDANLPLAKEYAWDFDNDDFALVDGKNVIVIGKEAVKIWIWKALQTQKNRYEIYEIYSVNYGNELEALISQGLSNAASNSEIERYIKEALSSNPYVLGISDVNMSLEGSKMNVDFKATTIYGEVTINV